MSARWPLEALHALRLREADAAAAALAAACAAERARAAERDARGSALSAGRAIRAAAERAGPGASAGAFAAWARRCELLRAAELIGQAALDEAERRLGLSREDVARARAGVGASRRAVELLEGRRAAWAAERRRRRERADEAAQDDRAPGAVA